MSTAPEVELIPEATPATPDLVCWIWAAIPPKNGRIHVARAAEALGVSTSTVYRWLRDPEGRQFNDVGMKIVRRRAILRGHGDYLWPPLDETSRWRAQTMLEDAIEAHDVIRDTPDRVPSGWRTNGTMEPHEVYLVSYPRAKVYGVASGRTQDTARKVRARHGEVLQRVTVSNKYAARVLKAAALEQVGEHRCIPPRTLVDVGRTETWHHRAGRVDLERVLRDSDLERGARS